MFGLYNAHLTQHPINSSHSLKSSLTFNLLIVSSLQNGLRLLTVHHEAFMMCQIFDLYSLAHALQGTIPVHWGSLAHLQILNLSSNQLTGSLPAALGQLQTNSGLWLDHNQFTGSIPEAWCNASVTSAVHVDHNPGLFGEVPECLQGRLDQGRGLEGTGLSPAISPISDQPAPSDQTSSSSSSNSDNAVFCNPGTCGSVFIFPFFQLARIHPHATAAAIAQTMLASMIPGCKTC